MRNRTLRSARAGVVIAVLAISGATGARAQGAAPDPQSLGIGEAIQRYCAVADPAAAQKVALKIAQLTRGASDLQLAQARKSAAYRRGYDEVNHFVALVAQPNAKRVCDAAPDATK